MYNSCMGEKVVPLPPEIRRQYDALFDRARSPLSMPRPETRDPDTALTVGRQIVRKDPGLTKAPLGPAQEWQGENAWHGGPILPELNPKKPL